MPIHNYSETAAAEVHQQLHDDNALQPKGPHAVISIGKGYTNLKSYTAAHWAACRQIKDIELRTVVSDVAAHWAAVNHPIETFCSCSSPFSGSLQK